VTSIVPVNPAEFMQDILINEGMRRPAVTREEQVDAFRQMLIEEIFLRDMFDNNTSIYKPDKENDDLNLGSAMTSIYSSYVRKELAAYMVEQGFLEAISFKEVKDSGQ
jgi:hypothetical protein